MAREWTRKSIEEIMKAVIAREGGGGGSVDWVSELAKALQNGYMLTGLNLISSTSQSISVGDFDKAGFRFGNYVSGNKDNIVVYDTGKIVFADAPYAVTAASHLQVGNTLDFFISDNWYSSSLISNSPMRLFVQNFVDHLKSAGELTSTYYGLKGRFSNGNVYGGKIDGVNRYIVVNDAIDCLCRFTVTQAPSSVDSSNPLEIEIPT